MTKLVATALAVLGLTLLAAQPAQADVKPALTLTVQAAAKADRGYVLGAHLQANDGKAVADATVRFYELVDFVGAREMLIGSATTDGRGDAALGYLPARTGSHAIVARFAGQSAIAGGSLVANPPAADRLAATEGRITFDATVAAAAHRVERSPLAAFSDRVPYGVAVVVLAVWGVIAFAFIAAARGVIGASDSTRKEETA